jgi:hypothetical protein
VHAEKKVVIFDMHAWCLVAVLAFAGSLEEVTRLGVTDWLHSDDYEMECSQHFSSWSDTLWSMWKVYNRGKASNTWLSKVHKEVLEMDCWKAGI